MSNIGAWTIVACIVLFIAIVAAIVAFTEGGSADGHNHPIQGTFYTLTGLGAALFLTWSVPLLAGSHVIPSPTNWTPPQANPSQSAAFAQSHTDRIQYESNKLSWFYAGPTTLPGTYVGLGHPHAEAHVCLYASAHGIAVQNEFHDGSRFRSDTGPCHSFAPTKNIWHLNANGSWTWIGPNLEGDSE